MDTKQLSQAAKEFRSEFSRYKLLRDFLEGAIVSFPLRTPVYIHISQMFGTIVL